MTLYETLRADLLKARKARNEVSSNILSTLVGAVSLVGKDARNGDPTDDEAKQMIVKFLKGVDETLSLVDANSVRARLLATEKEMLTAYLPKQLSETEVRGIILAQFPEKTNVGEVMGFLKANYANQYDGKVASKLAATVY